jgi:hypothetical protein
MDNPPSLKLTLPVGATPVVVAVKVTLAPAVDGLAELVSVVFVAVGALELTTCDSVALADAALVALPLYAATMLRVPTARLAVVQVAVRTLPLPVRATALQPAMDNPPSLKLTLPVGATPVVVAVKVTLAPAVDGLAELVSVVFVAVGALELTTCDSVALADAALVALPLYAATMLRVPTARLAVVQVAVRTLPLPVRATALQPAMDNPPSLKLTLPVGATPVVVAVKVTLAPAVDGLAELVSVVFVAVGALELTTCDSVALADAALVALPLYAATMLRVPTARLAVVQVAVRTLPLPVRATALQPAMDNPPSLKLTLPVGATPVVVAVKVTLAPAVDGLAELVSVVFVAVGALELTTCDSVALADAALVALPLYAATMLRVPTARLAVVQVAVRTLPLPVRATALQPAMDNPPSLKLTLPVGATPVVVAVKVTLAPAVDGLAELVSVVFVAVGALELTTCDSVALADAALVALPLYAATMLRVPTARLAVVQVAVRTLPLPVRATALQPAMDNPPSLKLTLPVGATPVVVAVKVTLAPAVDGLAELVSVVFVAVGALELTTCDSVALADAALVALPLYAATMLRVPTARLAVVQVAVRTLPLPVRATALQPAMDNPPSLKLTLPVGATPVVVAVKVTLAPAVDGLAELVSVVFVAVGALELTTCDSVALADAALVALPLYAATMLRVPTARLAVVQVAVRTLPLPVRATALQPAMDNPPSLKLTLPVGATPVVVAVNVTLAPAVDGLSELASTVVLEAFATVM